MLEAELKLAEALKEQKQRHIAACKDVFDAYWHRGNFQHTVCKNDQINTIPVNFIESIKMDTNVVFITFWQDLLFRQGGIFFILIFVVAGLFTAWVYDGVCKLFRKWQRDWWYEPTVNFIGIFTFFASLYFFHWLNMRFF